MPNIFTLALNASMRFMIPPPTEADIAPPKADKFSLPNLKRFIWERWHEEWVAHWLRSLDLSYYQWMGMARLSSVTTAAEAQSVLNMAREERLIKECVDRELRGEELMWHIYDGMGRLEAQDIKDAVAVCVVEEVEKKEGVEGLERMMEGMVRVPKGEGLEAMVKGLERVAKGGEERGGRSRSSSEVSLSGMLDR